MYFTRLSLSSMFLNCARHAGFWNRCNAIINSSDPSGTPSSRRICITSLCSSCSRLRPRSRELLAAILSDKLCMYSPKLQDLFFRGLVTTWSLLDRFAEVPTLEGPMCSYAALGGVRAASLRPPDHMKVPLSLVWDPNRVNSSSRNGGGVARS